MNPESTGSLGLVFSVEKGFPHWLGRPTYTAFLGIFQFFVRLR